MEVVDDWAGTPTRWRCEQCESVCEGVMESRPSPCAYCFSEDVVAVPMTAPLAPPKPPWDQSPAFLAALASDE